MYSSGWASGSTSFAGRHSLLPATRKSAGCSDTSTRARREHLLPGLAANLDRRIGVALLTDQVHALRVDPATNDEHITWPGQLLDPSLDRAEWSRCGADSIVVAGRAHDVLRHRTTRDFDTNVTSIRPAVVDRHRRIPQNTLPQPTPLSPASGYRDPRTPAPGRIAPPGWPSGPSSAVGVIAGMVLSCHVDRRTSLPDTRVGAKAGGNAGGGLFGDLGLLRSAGPDLNSAVNGGRVPEVEGRWG
jgi:hypothetical protein